MTEKEWLTTDSPYDMLAALSDRALEDERKLRLFGAACCRRHWAGMQRLDFVECVETAEEFVEGRIDAAELRGCYNGFMEMARGALEMSMGAAGWVMLRPHLDTTELETLCDALVDLVVYDNELRTDTPAWNAAVNNENAEQADVLREIFGNPYGGPRRPRGRRDWLKWRDGTVPKLARAAYEQRSLPDGLLDPARLAIVADALEEAGCTNKNILSHLRGPAPHVRGCWALDLLLLGKE